MVKSIKGANLEKGGEAGASGAVRKGYDKRNKRHYGAKSKLTPRPLDRTHTKPQPRKGDSTHDVDSSQERTSKDVGI